MQSTLNGFKIIFSKKDSVYVFSLSSVLILFFFFCLQNGSQSMEVFKFSFLTLDKKLSLFFVTLFDTTQLTGLSILPLVVLVTIFGGLTVSLLYTYIKMRKDILFKSGLYSGFGLVLALFGMGCAACGTILLQLVLSFFGFGGLMSFFPYHGVEVGYVGLVLLIANALFLSNKLGKPLVC